MIGQQDLLEAALQSLEGVRQDAEGQPPTIARMLTYLERNLFDPCLNVKTWKSACRIRDNNVAVTFHTRLGVPPKLYINRRRLEVAARMLRGTTLRVWRIAELTGFSSLGVFSKAFKRELGLRPLAFRQQCFRTRQPPQPEGFAVEELWNALEGRLSESRATVLIQAILDANPQLVPSSLATGGNKPSAQDRPLPSVEAQAPAGHLSP